MGNPLPDNEASRLLISEGDDQAVDASNAKPKPLTATTTNYDSLPLTIQDTTEEETTTPTCWSHYTLHLDQYPVLVKSITAFFLLGLGDAFAQAGQQWVAHSPSTVVGWDCLRSLRFGAFGLIGAPWTHYYYHLLDSLLPPTPSPLSWTTCLKVFIDQFVQAPIALFFIIGGLDVMKGVAADVVRADLRVHYWATLVINCKFVKSENQRRVFSNRHGITATNSSQFCCCRETLATGFHCQSCLCPTKTASSLCQCGLLSVDHCPFRHTESVTRESLLSHCYKQFWVQLLLHPAWEPAECAEISPSTQKLSNTNICQLSCEFDRLNLDPCMHTVVL